MFGRFGPKKIQRLCEAFSQPFRKKPKLANGLEKAPLELEAARASDLDLETLAEIDAQILEELDF